MLEIVALKMIPTWAYAIVDSIDNHKPFVVKRNIGLVILWFALSWYSTWLNLTPKCFINILTDGILDLILFVIATGILMAKADRKRVMKGLISLNPFSNYTNAEHSHISFHVILAAGMIILGLLTVVYIDLDTHYGVSKSYRSIPSTSVDSSQAPTMKKGETPVAITPKVVFSKIDNAWSDVPNSQYYTRSNNIQAQYYRGRPVYVVPLNYRGAMDSHRANRTIPGYFIVNATSPVFAAALCP